MVSTIVTVLGGIVLVLGLGSRWLEKSPIPATLLALLIGILLGPEVFGVVNPDALGDESLVLENAARLTLGVGLVSVALRIPKEFPRQHWRELLMTQQHNDVAAARRHRSDARQRLLTCSRNAFFYRLVGRLD